VSSIEPGWYKDPAEPTTQRYWDGEGWIGDPLPVDATPPAGPPRTPGAAARSGGTARSGPAPAVPPAPAATPGAPPPGTLLAPPGVPLPPGTRLPPGVPPGWVHPGYVPVAAPGPHGYVLAAPHRRLAARLLDVVAVLGLNLLVNGWFIVQWWRAFWPYFLESQRAGAARVAAGDVEPPEQLSNLQIVIMLIGVALWFAYEVPAVANSGQTFGKRLLGLKVLRVEEDAPPGFRRAIRRWNPMGLPTLLWICGIGFVLQFIDCLFVVLDPKLHQALHDRSAGTVVVHIGQSQDEDRAESTPTDPRDTA
jgi:uncharacterized RDD family membrane protein YckC